MKVRNIFKVVLLTWLYVLLLFFITAMIFRNEWGAILYIIVYGSAVGTIIYFISLIFYFLIYAFLIRFFSKYESNVFSVLIIGILFLIGRLVMDGSWQGALLRGEHYKSLFIDAMWNVFYMANGLIFFAIMMHFIHLKTKDSFKL